MAQPGRYASALSTVRYKEAKAHALIVAVILWTATLVAFVYPGDRFITGHLKGADFVYFYTLGHIAFEGDYPRVQEPERLYARQVALVPASQGDHHLSMYPPTAALVVAPVAALSYPTAVLVWSAITLAGFSLSVFLLWRSSRDEFPDASFVAIAAAAFPPLWSLIMFGQSTVIPLLAFVLGWWALKAGRPVWAGAALGLLAIKPQFGVVIGFVLVCSWQWRTLLGGTLSLAAQIAAVVATMGTQAIRAYGETIMHLPTAHKFVEPTPWQMHSLRTLTDLLPNAIQGITWSVAAAAIIVVTGVAWRRRAPLAPRFGLVVLATVLINPHLFVYDATVLVIPLFLIGAWVEQALPPWRRWFWQAVYGLCVLLLFPTAIVLYVQGSVLLMLWIFARVSGAIIVPLRTPGQALG